MKSRSATVFPKDLEALKRLGENIALALKRRKITQTRLTERTGLSMPTLRNIIRGEASVSIGHYVVVLSALGLSEDIAKVALDDEFGRKLQDIELLKSGRRKQKSSFSRKDIMQESRLLNHLPTGKDKGN